MGEFHQASLWRYLPHVIVTTLAVVVLPVLIVTELRVQGVISGIIPLLVAGLAISFGISSMGAAIWKTRPGSGDLLFGDLIVWGFVRRWRVDRRLSGAASLLGLHRDAGGEGDTIAPGRKAKLLEQLSGALEARDPYTHGHSRRVARHAATMARRMGLPQDEVAKIRSAAAIHDVGKVKTPGEVLAKPGGLTDGEFAVIKRHPVDGAEMVAELEDPELTEMVLHHHERLDGGGYPAGLSGDRIPLGSRIIAVADTFDAITSARPYRPAKAHKKALDVLRAETGSQLDPDAVEAFRGYYSGLRPVAVWAIVANFPQRLFAGLFDQLTSGVASASKVMAATAATVVAGARRRAVRRHGR
jgi:putative nucleotidyltransferase with HDIG domain